MAENDNPEWAALVDSYYQRIYRYCCQMLASATEAEDVTQEVFIKIFKNLGTVRDPKALQAWVYSIARNLCHDRHRWWSRTYWTFRRNFTVEQVTPPPTTISLHLRTLILQLPVRQREVFILRHLHEFSTQETADLLGLSPGTIKSHLKRAVDHLRDALAPSPGSETTEADAAPSQIADRKA